MINKLKKSKAGFTLVELIVVIAIIGVLAAVLVPQYIQYVNKSKAGADMSTLGEVLHAAQVTAALGNGDVTYTLTYDATNKCFTVDTALDDILGTTVTLKSSQGKAITANQTIKFTASDGKTGWGTNQQTTEAAFSTIEAAK